MNAKQRTGKLAAGALGRLLARYAGGGDPAVVVGAGIGLDAAAVAVRDGTLVLASDPVTYASEHIGRYAVHVNANDVFACGARPRWFLADILLPAGQGRLAERIFRDVRQACGELGVTLVGGHTEMTPDLPRPMVAGFMVGRAIAGRVITAAGVRPGDAIVLTKAVAIEGTAILLREMDRRRLEGLSSAVVRRGRRLLSDPGISVGPEAMIAARHRVHAMHDPTEGGLVNGLWEMAQASGTAFRVDVERVPVYPQTQALCRHLGIDPLRLLASGALLIACARGRTERLLAALASQGIPAREIGQVRRGAPAVRLSTGRTVRKAVADEILKAFDPDRADRRRSPPA